MLTRLHIQNYALIKEIDIEFDECLNIITGETGAGKSILLGALSLILGQRADMQALFDKSRKCIVEGEFNIDVRKLKSFFLDHDIDSQSEATIRREITSEGKSRAFINDTPVNLNTLRAFTSMLIDIHSQHETLQILQPSFQLSLVDSFAGNETLLEKYQSTFSLYKRKSTELLNLEESEKKSSADLDYFRFQLNELNAANLKTGELEQLEDEMKTLQHAEEIRMVLNSAIINISNEQAGISSQLNSVLNQLMSISKYQNAISEISARVKSVHIEVQDILSELENTESEISFSPERVLQLEERINLLNQLQYKHRVSSVNELMELLKSFEDKISGIESAGEKIETLKQETTILFSDLKSLAVQLSESRRKIIPAINKKISRLLAELKMPDAVFRIEQFVNEPENLSGDGADEIIFLFSANKGIEPMLVAKVASGGELSRLMLSIKASVAKQMSLPTMIFDEIDSGVSGEVALSVGKMMKELAANHQVIAITHLPQIASRADVHFIVDKEHRKGMTFTNLSKLTEEEHTLEIAKMIAGGKPSEAAIQNARELIG
ncbi:MAG: DNA repair protein RecN [Bacteroidia bacterium]|nr:DNA repair protein RecN [Bacteroidia bacterium]